MSDRSALRFERDGAIARLTLDRSDANALDVALARALMYAAIECDEDDAIRCVVLTGTGKYFCAGGDIEQFAAAGPAVPAYIKELTAYFHAAISRFARMRKPLVTSLNGPAAGAGLSLAVLGDIVLADPSVHLSLAYTAIGLSPDGGSTWLLPRLIGMRRTQEMAMLNTRVGAEDAARIGLITRVVADGTLDAQTQTVAAKLASSATQALGRTRSLLLSSFAESFETQMEIESRTIADASRSAESREGVRAFLEKRKPGFEAPQRV